MNVEPCDYSMHYGEAMNMHYGEAMNVKHAAPVETKIIKE